MVQIENNTIPWFLMRSDAYPKHRADPVSYGSGIQYKSNLTWRVLTRFNKDLMKFGEIDKDIVRSDKIWQKSDEIWCSQGEIRWYQMRFDDMSISKEIWWDLMISDAVRRHLMQSGKIRHKLVNNNNIRQDSVMWANKNNHTVNILARYDEFPRDLEAMKICCGRRESQRFYCLGFDWANGVVELEMGIEGY